MSYPEFSSRPTALSPAASSYYEEQDNQSHRATRNPVHQLLYKNTQQLYPGSNPTHSQAHSQSPVYSPDTPASRYGRYSARSVQFRTPTHIQPDTIMESGSSPQNFHIILGDPAPAHGDSDVSQDIPEADSLHDTSFALSSASHDHSHFRHKPTSSFPACSSTDSTPELSTGTWPSTTSQHQAKPSREYFDAPIPVDHDRESQFPVIMMDDVEDHFDKTAVEVQANYPPPPPVPPLPVQREISDTYEAEGNQSVETTRGRLRDTMVTVKVLSPLPQVYSPKPPMPSFPLLSNDSLTKPSPPSRNISRPPLPAPSDRVSTTNLPELIQRATRLVSLIGNGVRPASTLELDDQKDNHPTTDDLEGGGGYYHHRDGNTESTLQPKNRVHSAFWPLPVGGVAKPTPTGLPANVKSHFDVDDDEDGDGDGIDELKRRNRMLADGKNDKSKNKGRGCCGVGSGKKRVCGLAVWDFSLLALLALALVVAAIFIPLEFTVFHKNREAANSQENASKLQAAVDLAACQQRKRCENGGSNMISRGVCACVCTKGYTGTTCAIEGRESCTTISVNTFPVAGADEEEEEEAIVENATVGQAIPRLLDMAESKYGLTLNGGDIAAQFNAADASCAAENSLVTLMGTSSRSTKRGQRTSRVKRATSDDTSQAFEIDLGPSLSRGRPIQTSTPSVGDTGTVTNQGDESPTDTNDLADNDSTKEVTSNDGANSTWSVMEQDTTDFARVSILYILQEVGWPQAKKAQAALSSLYQEEKARLAEESESKFESSSDASTSSNSTSKPSVDYSRVDLGSGCAVDLKNWRVNIGDGFIGGKP